MTRRENVNKSRATLAQTGIFFRENSINFTIYPRNAQKWTRARWTFDRFTMDGKWWFRMPFLPTRATLDVHIYLRMWRQKMVRWALEILGTRVNNISSNRPQSPRFYAVFMEFNLLSHLSVKAFILELLLHSYGSLTPVKSRKLK